MYYFGPGSGVPDPFWYEFTGQQREMISAIASAIKFRDDQSMAASRGEGKTTIFERLVTKYVLQGVVSYAVLCAATGTLADNSLDSIKTAIEENPLLLADYPEVCVPVQALEHTPNRAHTQLVSGIRHDNGQPYHAVPSRFSWCGNEIIFPNVPGSPSARAIVATRGLDSAIRGLKKKGRRPQIVGIDDPDTPDSVRNPDQATKLEEKIDRDIGGLGTQQQQCGRVMLTTLQNRTCVSYKYTDPAQKHSWKGKRFRYLVTPPDRKEMWEEYVAMRRTELQDFALKKSTDRHCRRSHQMYLDNREIMDAGAVVANPHRFNPELLPDGSQVEVSSLQHYYNEVARLGEEAVATEYDNDPPEEEGHTVLVLTAHHIQHNCISGLEKRFVPEGTACITTGADLQKLGLHYVVIAWDANAVGCIIDYDFFEFVGTKDRPAGDCERLILEGLFAWHAALDESPFLNVDGEVFTSDLTLLDTGWKEESWNDQPVQLFCSQVGYRHFLPSKGIPNYRRPHDSPKLVIGDNWHIAFPGHRPVAELNSDHWKLKVHEGFLAERGQPGSLAIFNHPKIDGRTNRTAHMSFSKHILRETWETRAKPGFKGSRTGFWKTPGPNHWFDATYQAIAARSIRGINVFDSPHQSAPAAPKAPAPTAPSQPRVIEVPEYYEERERW